jgi:hypothetical protein
LLLLLTTAKIVMRTWKKIGSFAVSLLVLMSFYSFAPPLAPAGENRRFFRPSVPYHRPSPPPPPKYCV